MRSEKTVGKRGQRLTDVVCADQFANKLKVVEMQNQNQRVADSVENKRKQDKIKSKLERVKDQSE